jgi:hypothetical protein
MQVIGQGSVTLVPFAGYEMKHRAGTGAQTDAAQKSPYLSGVVFSAFAIKITKNESITFVMSFCSLST